MTEIRNYYTTAHNYERHFTYSGTVSNFDFEGHHTLKSMADRIEQDLRFDERCRRNAIARDMKKQKKVVPDTDKSRKVDDVNVA